MNKSDLSTFNLFKESAETLNKLTDKQVANIMKAVFRSNGLQGNLPKLTQLEEIVFGQINGQMRNYDNRRHRNQLNGAKGGRPPNNPHETETEPTENPNETTNTNINTNIITTTNTTRREARGYRQNKKESSLNLEEISKIF